MMSKTNTSEEKAFFQAIANCHIRSVEAMVTANRHLLDAYDYECFGATPITRAGFAGDREMIQTLIDLGADVDRRSDWEMGPWSPLHTAVHGRNIELAKFLVERGATLDAHGAAGMGLHDELRQMLDENPQAVHQRGGDGCQPLHFADTIDVARLLIDRGAEIDARCVDHFSTPVQYLASCRPQVARFLFAQGATPDIFSAVMAGDHRVVEHLLSENPDVLSQRIDQKRFPPGPDHDVHNIMTFTIGQHCGPIHAAAKGNQPSMAQLLIEKGQSPDLRGGYDDQTALHSAAWNNHLQVATALVDHGADINIRSGRIHNNSPAGWAIVAGSADVFEMLLDRGAEVLDWFSEDAQAAMDGKFLPYKRVAQDCYQRIWNCLRSR
jgi:ankyrin repeat protein